MTNFKDLFRSADWKTEKHVPVIDVPQRAAKDEFFPVSVTIGKEVAHPNTTQHHIRWIEVYFHPDDEQFPYQIGKAEFTAHGASVKGPDQSGIYTHHGATLNFKTNKSGTIYASSYCNIHGLWENSRRIEIE